MEVEALRGIGAKVTASAVTVDKSFTPRVVDLVPGKQAPVPGWAASAAAASIVGSWRTFVTTLHDNVKGHGDALNAAANAQAAADERAAGRQQRAGG
jgi:hypothetical protein